MDDCVPSRALEVRGGITSSAIHCINSKLEDSLVLLSKSSHLRLVLDATVVLPKVSSHIVHDSNPRLTKHTSPPIIVGTIMYRSYFSFIFIF